MGAAGCYGQHPQEWGACPLQESLAFVRSLVKEVITSTNSNLTMSLLKLLDCFFKPFLPKEDDKCEHRHFSNQQTRMDWNGQI